MQNASEHINRQCCIHSFGMAATKTTHRVVVQLHEIDPESCQTPPTQQPYDPQNIIAEIEVIDNCTIKCLMSEKTDNYHMHFNCVGFTNEPRLQRELSKVMTTLLHDCNNSCIIHFNAMRHNPMQFLAKMLVQELDRRLLPTFSTLNCITLEYYDMRKYDMINMFSCAEPNQNSTTSLQRGKRRKCAKTFTNTVELFRWLRTDFVQLWAAGKGHDCFDVKIVYVDGRSRLHRVKLMMYEIYLSELDADEKIHLGDFLQNVGDARKHCTSILTDCLREYFDSERLLSTLLFFDVPIMKGGALILNDMLTLAQAAYIGAQTTITGDTDVDVLSMDLNMLPTPAKGPALTSQPSKKLPAKTSYTLAENLSMNDLNALSCWYSRIDESFNNVIKAMERYYETVYQNKTAKIYSELKSIVNFSKSLQQINVEHDTPSTLTVHEAKQAMVRYRDAINDFRALVKVVDRCSYNTLLWVYLKTKNYDLLRHVLQFKEKQLEYCQTSLISVINQEIAALQNIKNT